MKVKINCLILAAGFGTRMGERGRDIPKVLWPINNTSILEFQIKYAKALGAERIFINSHFLHEKLKVFIDALNDPQVTLVYEKELLNIGGAIYNIANNYIEKNDSEILLILNGDQFLFFNEDIFIDAVTKVNNYHALLFMTEVSDPSYNKVTINNQNMITGIISNVGPGVTYSGMGLINLSKLEKRDGVHQFFNSVCDYNKKEIYAVRIEKPEYWDFGTLERYEKSIARFEKVSKDFFKM